MTSYALVKKNDAVGWTGYISLSPLTSTGHILSNPTLATGDVIISLDGGSFANLATLPVVTPASSGSVKIVLSQAEINADNINIKFIDQTSPAEWCDVFINMRTAARAIDDLAFPLTSGRGMVVDAAGLVDANAVKSGPTGAGTAQTAGDVFARIGAPAGASIAADIAAVKSDTGTTLTDVNTGAGALYSRIGAPAGASIAADIAAAKVDTAAIKVKTDFLPSATAGAAGGVFIAGTNAATTITTSLTTTFTGNLTGSVASVSGLTASDVGAIKTKTDFLPSATAGAAGGVFIAGTNAPVVITGSGDALTLTSTGANGNGINASGNGSGAGIKTTGGATGNAIMAIGGATSGDGVNVTVTSGHGVSIVATGTAKDGIRVTGAAASGANAGGHALNLTGGASSSTGGGTAGVGAKVTGGAGSASNNGAGEGITVAGGGTITVAGANAVSLTGTGALAGLLATAGATGSGVKIVGGGTSGAGITITTTSGDGIVVSPTAGNGVNITANGTSKHGLLVTGGTAGTSDGIKATAGTGGVDIRGNITGNLVGTVSTLTTYTGNTVQTGDAFARLGAPAGASVSADIVAVKGDTGTILTDVNSGAGAIYTRIGAPAGASIAADIAAAKGDTAAIKTQTDKLAFTVANQIDANVLDWKSAAAPAMTGDAYARLGAPAGASTAADIAAVQTKVNLIPGTIDGKTFAQGWTLTMSAMFGKASGLSGATAVYRAIDDSKDRITATVDAYGDRSAVTLDAS